MPDKDLDSYLDEMGAEIRALQEEITKQNIIHGAFKQYIERIEQENGALKLRLRRLAA